MKSIKLPKRSIKGLTIYCKKCHVNKPKCNHNEDKVFRAIVYVPGGGGAVKTKMLKSENYDKAVIEAFAFKQELIDNNFEKIDNNEEGNDYNFIGAIL